MVKHLFPNFLSNSFEYAQVEALWRESWDKLICQLRQENKWQTPWLNTQFADGTPFQDANPIFSAVSPTRGIGVRVIQIEPSTDAGEINAWTDTFAKGEPGAIKHLVINCSLTNENLQEALDLMKRWITEEVGTFPGIMKAGFESTDLSALDLHHRSVEE